MTAGHPAASLNPGIRPRPPRGSYASYASEILHNPRSCSSAHQSYMHCCVARHARVSSMQLSAVMAVAGALGRLAQDRCAACSNSSAPSRSAIGTTSRTGVSYSPAGSVLAHFMICSHAGVEETVRAARHSHMNLMSIIPSCCMCTSAVLDLAADVQLL